MILIKKMKIGIVGNGFVGRATALLCDHTELIIYDVNPELCVPQKTTIHNLMDCDFIFVCVPTPENEDGSCNTKMVESVISKIQFLNYNGFLVIRSTVPVGFCEQWNCYFMPEFLTEKNYVEDVKNNKLWIFGCKSHDTSFQQLAIQFISSSDFITSHNVCFISTQEAEMVKYFKNCFLATKVSFCNEMYQFCKQKHVDYNQIKNIACLDDRIGFSHTNVPGHDGKFGFGGTCFPKDMNSVISQMDHSIILKAVMERNKHDRE